MMKAMQSRLIDEFMRSIMKSKKCENCGGFSPAFRRDGWAKIFQKPLPKKYRDIMNNLGIKTRSALEETQDGLYDNDRNRESDDDFEEESSDGDDYDDSNNNNVSGRRKGGVGKNP